MTTGFKPAREDLAAPDSADQAANGYVQHYPPDIREHDDQWVLTRRRNFNRKAKAGSTAGLALSGGGVRSATFCLGVLQALARRDKLRYFDFLSTVSGGGYVGACMTWLYQDRKSFPFGAGINDARGRGGEVLAWLRCRGKYLTPGTGMGLPALISALLGAAFVNLFILAPMFLLAINLLDSRIFNLHDVAAWIAQQASLAPAVIETWEAHWKQVYGGFWLNGFNLFLGTGALLLLVFLLRTLWAAVLSGQSYVHHMSVENAERRWLGWLLLNGVVMTVIGVMPLVHSGLKALLDDTGLYFGAAGSVAAGLASTLFGRWFGKGGNERSGVPAWAYSIGLALTAFGIFMIFYHLGAKTGMEWRIQDELVLQIWLVLAVFCAFFADINHVSMHRYYRNRLMEAYMPRKLVSSGADPNRFRLRDRDATCGAPMPIINTTVCTVGSRTPVLGQRGGANFVFTPAYHGCQATGYWKRRSAEQRVPGKRDMDLATAMAISGAAVNPNNYFTRSRPLSFLMSLFNLRLGYWFPNPGWPDDRRWPPKIQPPWYGYMLQELFGRGLHEGSEYVHLSDGGHFENLGVYELLRRRCRFILVVDAGMDDQRHFEDLARLIELARVDFGIYIEIDVADLRPDEKTGVSKRPFAIGRIDYRGYSDAERNGREKSGARKKDDSVGDTSIEHGWLLYVKSSLLGEPMPELESYRAKNPLFPHESTADQFFTEEQFEAYRELGYTIGRLVRGDPPHDTPPAIAGFWEQLIKESGCAPQPESRKKDKSMKIIATGQK